MPSAASRNRPGGRTTPAPTPASKPATPAATPPANPSSYLKYPRDLSEGNGDYVQIKFYNYKPPYAGGNSTGSFLTAYNGVYTQSKGNSAGLEYASGFPTIYLYMPEDLSTVYASKWGGRDFGPLAPAALALGSTVMNVGNKTAMDTAGAQFRDKISGIVSTSALPYVGARLMSAAMNVLPGMGGNVSPNDILATTKGEILNPNTEVLYQGPELRTFNLNFKMLARNEDESKEISKICYYFKRASLPSGIEGNINISVPKMVDVSFMHKGSLHPYISQFKMSAIGNVDIKYTADGAWASYTTGAPVAVQLGLQFQELKLVYAEDVTDGAGSY